jgi:hypothetical protein
VLPKPKYLVIAKRENRERKILAIEYLVIAMLSTMVELMCQKLGFGISNWP